MAAMELIVASIEVAASVHSGQAGRFRDASTRLEVLSNSLPIRSVADFPAYIITTGGLPRSQLVAFSHALKSCVLATQPCQDIETTQYRQMKALLSVRELLQSCEAEQVVGAAAARKKLRLAAAELQSRGLCDIAARFGAEADVERWYAQVQNKKAQVPLLETSPPQSDAPSEPGLAASPPPGAGTNSSRSQEGPTELPAAVGSGDHGQEAAAESAPLIMGAQGATWNQCGTVQDGRVRLRQAACRAED